MELNERVVDISKELFFKWGIKSVSMDQLAAQLGISKRTLYENFKDKDTLVLEVLDQLHAKQKKVLYAILEQDIPEVQKLLEIFVKMHKTQMQISPMFFRDLYKYYYPVYNKIINKRQKDIDEVLLKLYKSAQKNGYFLSDLDMNIVFQFINDMLEDKLNYIMNDQISLQELQRNILRPFMSGISTPKGVEAFNAHRAKEGKLKK